MAQSSISKCNSCNRETGDLFCYDCKKHLCRTCKTFHDTFTKGHTITQSKNVDKAVLNTDILCGKHSQEYAYFCKGCKCLICGICAVKEHKSHKFDTVADTALKFRENLKTTATKLDSKAKEVLNQIEEIENEVLPDLLKKKHVFEDEVKLFSEDFLGIVREVTASQLHSADEWVEREQCRLQQHLIDLKESRDQILGNGKFIENQLTIQHDSTFLSLTFHENLHLKDTEIIPMLEATPLEELDKGAYVKTVAKRIQTKHDIKQKIDQSSEEQLMKKELIKLTSEREHSMVQISNAKKILEGKDSQIKELKNTVDKLNQEVKSLGQKITFYSTRDIQRTKPQPGNVQGARKKQFSSYDRQRPGYRQDYWNGQEKNSCEQEWGGQQYGSYGQGWCKNDNWK